jgi:hypothetical protein
MLGIIFGISVYCLLIFYVLPQFVNEYANVCNDFNITSVEDYNGTRYGGYSCFRKSDRIDIYFNPLDEDRCFGCHKEIYHFVCYDGKYNYCFLAEKLVRVEVKRW